MTVWVYHLALTPQEEETVATRTELPFDIQGMPDLTKVESLAGLHAVIKLLKPDLPPESAMRQADRMWDVLGEVKREDLLVVPLPTQQCFAIAEVTTRYMYHDNDRHVMEVTWFDARPRLSLFRHDKTLLAGAPGSMKIVESPQLRIKIRDQLPHRYNRFAKWKWIIAGVICIKLVMFALHWLSTGGDPFGF